MVKKIISCLFVWFAHECKIADVYEAIGGKNVSPVTDFNRSRLLQPKSLPAEAFCYVACYVTTQKPAEAGLCYSHVESFLDT